MVGLTWIVERTFAWLARNRRLSKDYELKNFNCFKGAPLSPILAAVLKRDRAIGLAGVTALSWAYLICMDWGMRHTGYRNEHGHHARHAALDHLGSSSR